MAGDAGRRHHPQLAVPDHRHRFLSQPHTPDIPGIHDFDGKVIHTTAWDDGYDPAGKRIGLIGTGATAVQLIPELAKKAGDLTVYQRTAIHVVPKIDFGYPDWARRLFARLPITQRAVRAVTDAIYEFFNYVVLHQNKFSTAGSTSAVQTRPRSTGFSRSAIRRCAGN